MMRRPLFRTRLNNSTMRNPLTPRLQSVLKCSRLGPRRQKLSKRLRTVGMFFFTFHQGIAQHGSQTPQAHGSDDGFLLSNTWSIWFEIQRSRRAQVIAASDSRDRCVSGFHLDRCIRLCTIWYSRKGRLMSLKERSLARSAGFFVE